MIYFANIGNIFHIIGSVFTHIPKYVANVVKEVTGLTAGDCIDVNIIRQAKALMQIKTLTLQQISDSLGFQNQSHFGTFFHRHTGLRPKAFRLNTFAHS